MEEIDWLSQLPAECIAGVIALTPAKDACRVAAVSKFYRSIADSDSSWKPRLPFNINRIISNSLSPLSQFLNSLPRKDLYLHLSHNPILLGDGNTSFALEKESGNVCYMSGAKALKIGLSDSPDHWYWESDPESRFGKVAMLDLLWTLEIEGRIEARKLTRKTKYAGYFVFKLLLEDILLLERRPVKLRVYAEGDDELEEGIRVLLDPPEEAATHIREREDGWKEVKMGEIYNDFGDDASIIFSIQDEQPFEGIAIEGIEIRPEN